MDTDKLILIGFVCAWIGFALWLDQPWNDKNLFK